jgi:predicted transglutaminase-like cysteine proteinase
MLMLGATLASAACANLPETSAPMTVAGPAAAPQGFVQFCERQPVDCGATVAELDAMRLTTSQTIASPLTAALTFDWTPVFAQQRAASQRLLAQPTAASVDASSVVALNGKTWALLTSTNDSVNRAMAQRNDLEVYGVSERWATPLESGQRLGDCEDFVLEKRRALIAAGLPAAALSIAVVVTDRRQTHAVLLVATDKDEYVLDNLSPWVLPWTKTGYEWRERQVAGSASNWAFAAD